MTVDLGGGDWTGGGEYLLMLEPSAGLWYEATPSVLPAGLDHMLEPTALPVPEWCLCDGDGGGGICVAGSDNFDPCHPMCYEHECSDGDPDADCPIELQRVTFLGGHAVRKDSDGKAYGAMWNAGKAHPDLVCQAMPPCCDVDPSDWSNACKKTAHELGINRNPIAYTRGSKVRTSPLFRVTGSLPQGNIESIEITGTSTVFGNFSGPGKIVYPISGGPWIVPKDGPFESNSTLPDNIAHHEMVAIDWTVTVTTDENETVQCNGTSENPLYVTLADPILGVTLFHTVIHRGCVPASGHTAQPGALNAIWNHFRSRQVRNHKNQPVNGFTYWGPAGVGDGCAATSCLINEPFDGSCAAWGIFMRDVLWAQGIGATAIQVSPNPNAPGLPIGTTSDRLWVKHWTDIGGPNQAYNPIPAQGGNPTEGYFANHVLVMSFASGALLYYDPSYGTEEQPSLLLWQQNALSAVSFYVPGSVEPHAFENAGANWAQLIGHTQY